LRFLGFIPKSIRMAWKGRIKGSINASVIRNEPITTTKSFRGMPVLHWTTKKARR
jgi:hypothetical protein